MSYTNIDNDIIRSDKLKPIQKIVLIAILSYYNEDKGYSFPSHKVLMKDCCVKDKGTLIKAINDLESLGFLKKETVKGKGNKYFIEKNENCNNEKNDSVAIENVDKIEPTPKVTPKKSKKPSNESSNKKGSSYKELIEAYTKDDNLVEAINDFIDMRKKIKKPLTERALKTVFNKLDKFADNDIDKIEILENSIMNCWQGIFELKNKKAPAGTGTNKFKNNNYTNSICNNGKKNTQRVEVINNFI